MNTDTVHEALTPVKWLLGNWKSIEAEGFYPTIKPFKYQEELSFTSLGQPCLNYSSKTWNPANGKAMHLENGFLRVRPGSKEVCLMIAHNFGLTSKEEGIVEGNQLQLKSTDISRMPFAKDPEVKSIERIYKLNEKGNLEFSLSMATANTNLAAHLRVIYEKS